MIWVRPRLEFLDEITAVLKAPDLKGDSFELESSYIEINWFLNWMGF